jgi:membrane dipeptidase
MILRVTLIHLTPSPLGWTSTPIPFARDRGLSRDGETLVHALEARRVLVDLAHASKNTFWDVVRVHDPARPLLVSHTGVSGVHDHWRNLDDAQLRAVADSGGTIGVLYHVPFLGDAWHAGRVATVARHIEHIVRTVGDDFASLGSDWDGAIIPPRDMPTCLELPRLVQALLDVRLSPESIRKIVGENFLRVVRAVRR